MVKNYYFNIKQVSLIIDLEKHEIIQSSTGKNLLGFLLDSDFDAFLQKISMISINKNHKHHDFSSNKNIITFLQKHNYLMYEQNGKSYFIDSSIKTQKDNLIYYDLTYVKIPSNESTQDTSYVKINVIGYDDLDEVFSTMTAKHRSGNFFVIDFNSYPSFTNNIFIATNIINSIFNNVTKVKELLVTIDNKIIVIYDKQSNNLSIANYVDEILNQRINLNVSLNYFYGKFDQFNFYNKYQIEKLFNGFSKLNKDESSFRTFYEKKKFYDKTIREIGHYLDTPQNVNIIQKEHEDSVYVELSLDIQDLHLFYLSLISPEFVYRLLISLIQRANSIIQSDPLSKVIITIPIWFVIFSNNLNYLFSNIILNFRNDFINEDDEGYFKETLKNIRKINHDNLIPITIEYKIDDMFSNNYNLYGFKTVLLRNQLKDVEKYDTEEQYKWQLFTSKIDLLKTTKLHI